MARSKKHYNSWTKSGPYEHQSRGGVPGKCVDSGFGSPSNNNKSKKNYAKVGGAK